MENREVEHLVGKYKEWPKISNSSFFNMENCSNGVKEIYSQIDINRLMENPESKNDFLQLLRPILSKGYIERLALPGNEEEKEMFLEDINTLICSINYLSPVQIRSIVSVIEDPYGIHSQFHRDHMRILYDIAFGEESDVIKDEKIEKIAFYITNPCWRNLRENIEDLEFLAKEKD